MCQINENNSVCNFQSHFQKWQRIEEVHHVPSDIEAKHLHLPISTDGYCLFHSPDIGWKKQNDFDRYLINFFTLSEWDKEITSVEMVNALIVAPANRTDIVLNGTTFKKKVRIAHSRFVDNVHFKSSTFAEDTDFFNVKFEGEVYFNESQSFKAFFFVRCHFYKKAYFNAASFYGETTRDHSSFNFSTFEAQANSSGCKFLGKNSDANFQLITFKDIVYLTGSQFEKRALFNGTKFEKRADFDGVAFQQDVFFTSRPEEGKTFKPIFTEANFSKALFHGKAAFDDAYMGKAVFSGARIYSILQFGNTVFENSVFDELFLESNGRIHFTGSQENVVFTDTVSFHVIRERFKGYVYFKQVKVAYITAPHLSMLQELREAGNVFFSDDCEFAVNSNYVSYKVSGAKGNYDVFNAIFEGLKKWIYIFLQNPKRLSLDVIKTDPSANTILIKVIWNQQQDFDLYVNLSLYYFQSLPCQEADQEAFLKKMSDNAFLKSLLGQDQEVDRDIKTELENHIEEVSLIIKNTLKRASVIDFELRSQRESLYSDKPDRNSSEYQIDLIKLTKDVKQVFSATSVNMVKQLPSRTGSQQVRQSTINNINFNGNTFVYMDNRENYVEGNISLHQSNLQIGQGNEAHNTIRENDLNFTELLEELPQLIVL